MRFITFNGTKIEEQFNIPLIVKGEPGEPGNSAIRPVLPRKNFSNVLDPNAFWDWYSNGGTSTLTYEDGPAIVMTFDNTTEMRGAAYQANADYSQDNFRLQVWCDNWEAIGMFEIVAFTRGGYDHFWTADLRGNFNKKTVAGSRWLSREIYFTQKGSRIGL